MECLSILTTDENILIWTNLLLYRWRWGWLLAGERGVEQEKLWGNFWSGVAKNLGLQ